MKISLNEGWFVSKLYKQFFNILKNWAAGNIPAAVCESI